MLRLTEGLLTSIPCFVLAATLMLTWIDPMSIDQGSWVKFGVGIMVLEFVLVHSGAMMGSMAGDTKDDSPWQKIKVLATATAFYGLFAGAMALAFKSWTLFAIYSVVMCSRWIAFFTHPEDAGEAARHRSGMSVIYYLVAVFLSVLVPWPRLGVTPSVVREVYPDRGTGHWESHPESALAAGVVYFTLLGITELYMASKAVSTSTQET